MTLVPSAALNGADRTARTITPEGSPLWIDPFRATLFDTPALSVSVTNQHAAPLQFTLRIWVFDQSERLRGTMLYCVNTPLDRSMRGVFYVPLDIRGVTPRDRGVVTVESVVGDRILWTLQEPPEEQVEAARAEVRGFSGRLSFARHDSEAVGPFTCPCDCPPIQSSCEQVCGHQSLAAFSCFPADGTGCAAGCSCK
jgi:hypothetical protein